VLNLGTGELLVVFLVALLVLGPTKLPEAARQAGRMMAELRRLSSGFQAEMRDAMREPTPTLPPLPPEAQHPPVTTPAEPATTPTAARRRRAPLRADGAGPADAQRSE
jgi:sec-independent protein translocase protein TatB